LAPIPGLTWTIFRPELTLSHTSKRPLRRAMPCWP
jgi:hypothetical protein